MKLTAIMALTLLTVLLPVQRHAAAFAAASQQATPQTHVLFRWTIPQKGRVGAWTASNGVLSYGGGGVGTAMPRYTVPAHTNFAVQAMLRTTGPGPLTADLNGFGLVAREKRSDAHRAVAGGSFFNTYFNPDQENNTPELYWNGQTIGQEDFQPGSTWHLYRLTVQGDQYSLSIDGKPMVMYSVPDYPSPRVVGVFSWYYQVKVKHFEVDSIGTAATQLPFDPVPRAANLTVGDLPTTGSYRPYLSHWYSNEETAREDNVSLSSLQAAGRIVSYGVEFYPYSRDVTDIYSVISAFGTSEEARAFFQARFPVLEQAGQSVPGEHNFQEFSGLNLGDVSAGFRVDGSEQGVNARAVLIYFVRGRYTELLRLGTDPDPGWAPDPAATAAIAIGLAQTIDARLPRS
jgi:hypothetical protein